MAFEGWAIVEIMGHRRLAGYVSEVSIAGAAMLRVDIAGKEPGSSPKATQFYGGASLFCLTPTTEENARKEANPSAWTPYQLGSAVGEDEDPCTVATACRACSECEGNHHFSESGLEFPEDESPHFVCKHCEVKAAVCESCQGAIFPITDAIICAECTRAGAA